MVRISAGNIPIFTRRIDEVSCALNSKELEVGELKSLLAEYFELSKAELHPKKLGYFILTIIY